MIALGANDQLRQRIAWALAQIFVIVPDQLATGWTHSESFLNFYDSKIHCVSCHAYYYSLINGSYDLTYAICYLWLFKNQSSSRMHLEIT